MKRLEPSDEALFLRYREDGDPTSFGLLYDRYGPAVYRFLQRLLRDPAAAEDLTQHTFLRRHEARGSFDPRRSRRGGRRYRRAGLFSSCS